MASFRLVCLSADLDTPIIYVYDEGVGVKGYRQRVVEAQSSRRVLMSYPWERCICCILDETMLSFAAAECKSKGALGRIAQNMIFAGTLVRRTANLEPQTCGQGVYSPVPEPHLSHTHCDQDVRKRLCHVIPLGGTTQSAIMTLKYE